MLDPPDHTRWRHRLKPFFSPSRVAAMEEGIRDRCVRLVEDLATRGSCDFVADFACRFPTGVFLEFMGLPEDRLEVFLEWAHAIMRLPFTTGGMTEALKAAAELSDYFARLVKERRTAPGDDVISQVLAPGIPDADFVDLCFLLFMAGMDTVNGELSYMFWHLATHDDDRAAIAARPELIPTAIEELLRVYPVSSPARKVTADIDGCPMKAGDMVLLAPVMAHQDAAAFPEPNTVLLDRTPNHHLAFGAGPHHCLGSHLARKQLHIALEEWHRRIPDYRLSADAQVPEHGGQTFGIDALPLTWNR
jgi:cytochrome P450